MVEFDRFHNSDKNATSRLKITVVGVGGGGLNVLDRISLDRMMEASLVSMDTDIRDLNHSMAPSKIQLGSELILGIGSGGDPDLAAQAAEDTADEIRGSLYGSDIVFICGGLGGGTCSGAAPVIAKIAKRLGAMVFVFASMPFSFQGRRTVQQAEEARLKLQDTSDALILFENSRMGELILPKEGIQKAFSQADQLIGHSIRAISSIVNQRGLIGMNIADVMAALSNPDARCLFGYGEARGQTRVQDVLKRAMKSPLINEGDLLKNSKNLLVHIAGGENFTLDEVQNLMTELSKKVPDSTRIMFGLSSDAKLGDSVCLTLLSSLTASEVIPSTIKAEVAAVAPKVEPAPVMEVAKPVIETLETVAPEAPQAIQIEIAPEPLPVVAPTPEPVTAPVAEAPAVIAPAVIAPSVEAKLPVEEPALPSVEPEIAAPAIETSLSQLVASHQAASQVPAPVAEVAPEPYTPPVVKELPVVTPEIAEVPAPVVNEVKPVAFVSPAVPEVAPTETASAIEAPAPVVETRQEAPASPSLFKLVEEAAQAAAAVPAPPVVEESPRAVVNPNWLDRYISSANQVQAEAKAAEIPPAAPVQLPVAEVPVAPAPTAPAPQAAPSSLFRVVGAPQAAAPAPARVEAPATPPVAPSEPAAPTAAKPETSLGPAPSLASMFSVVAANRGTKDPAFSNQSVPVEKAPAASPPPSFEDSAEENLDVPTWLRMRQKNKN